MGLAVRYRAGRVALEDPAARAGRVGLGVLEDMNRVAPGVLEDMGLADLASPGVRDQVGRAALADRVDRALRALDPEGRKARDLSLGRALLGRMPTALGRALLDRMPTALGRTRPADRLWEPMTRVEATRPEARMRLGERTRRAGATHLTEATDSSRRFDIGPADTTDRAT